MRDKLDREKERNVLVHIRRHIKKSIWLFPKDSSTQQLLLKMSEDLKKHINTKYGGKENVDNKR